jgi:hypothetical protein
MWLGLILVIVLTGLSIYGSFVGANHAGILFNTPAMQLLWVLLTVGLAISIILFPSLVKRPSLFLIHLGGICILVGSMFASATGHQIQRQLFDKYKVPMGRMLIYEGHKTNRVLLPKGGSIFELPFDVALEDFRIEYYEPSEQDEARMPKAFLSDLHIIRDGETAVEKTIKVNHPLHYGGFYFYQHSYDDKAGQYTILTVTSDNGIYIVFTGYVLLAAGLFGRCWFAPMIKGLRKK